jgi:hypothetical protein
MDGKQARTSSVTSRSRQTVTKEVTVKSQQTVPGQRVQAIKKLRLEEEQTAHSDSGVGSELSWFNAGGWGLVDLIKPVQFIAVVHCRPLLSSVIPVRAAICLSTLAGHAVFGACNRVFLITTAVSQACLGRISGDSLHHAVQALQRHPATNHLLPHSTYTGLHSMLQTYRAVCNAGGLCALDARGAACSTELLPKVT